MVGGRDERADLGPDRVRRFAKHTLLSILTRYCVLTADKMLLVMRPYQIAATERILQKIQVSTNYKKLGTFERAATSGTPRARARR